MLKQITKSFIVKSGFSINPKPSNNRISHFLPVQFFPYLSKSGYFLLSFFSKYLFLQINFELIQTNFVALNSISFSGFQIIYHRPCL